eukprot:364255-Chlamydomonas_euryale.AAC.3
MQRHHSQPQLLCSATPERDGVIVATCRIVCANHSSALLASNSWLRLDTRDGDMANTGAPSQVEVAAMPLAWLLRLCEAVALMRGGSTHGLHALCGDHAWHCCRPCPHAAAGSPPKVAEAVAKQQHRSQVGRQDQREEHVVGLQQAGAEGGGQRVATYPRAAALFRRELGRHQRVAAGAQRIVHEPRQHRERADDQQCVRCRVRQQAAALPASTAKRMLARSCGIVTGCHPATRQTQRTLHLVPRAYRRARMTPHGQRIRTNATDEADALRRLRREPVHMRQIVVPGLMLRPAST